MINSLETLANIKSDTGQLFSSTAQNPASLLRHLNDGIRRLSLDGLWEFNNRIFDTVGDGIATSVDINEFITIYGILRGGKLLHENQDWVYGKDYYLNLDKIGVFSSKLYIPAVSTEAYRIIYRGFPAKVTAEQTLIDIPDYCSKAIELASIMYAYYSINQKENAGEYANAYKSELARLRDMLSNVLESKVRRMSSKHNW